MSETLGQLEIKHLGVDFATSAGPLHAVVDASLRVEAGQSLGLVGESGSGKTVTALSAVGLTPSPGRVVAGEIWFDGRNLLAQRPAVLRGIRGRDIGVIFQDPGAYLNPVKTIGDQVAEPLLVHRFATRRHARRRAIELLEMVGIPSPADRIGAYPHQFSGGMRQRVMIATALACKPRLLIADEPTTALDVTIQAQIVDLLVALRAEFGMSLILITHDVGLVAGIVDRIAVMYAGRVVESGDVFDIFESPAHPYTVGLLSSVPRLDEPPGTRLQVIGGTPPDPAALPSGCPFRVRCRHAMEVCAMRFPPTELLDRDHTVNCWLHSQDGQGQPAADGES
jgi:oligopeptide transport system ATP-binding protein